MNKEILLNTFLKEVKTKIPTGPRLTNTLMDILMIEKEAVYRRLRGEVPFTFLEVAVISKEIGISVDNLINSTSGISTLPLQFKINNNTDFREFDCAILKLHKELMEKAKEENSCLIDCTNILPQALYGNYDSLLKFHFFKWIYQYRSVEEVKEYKKTEIPEKLFSLNQDYINCSNHLKNTYYIWDKFIFQYMVDDIKYFSSIYLITPEEVRQLKEDLLKFIDEIELLATKGYFPETGYQVHFYISNISFDSNYWLFQSYNYHISIIKAFMLNAVIELDENSLDKIKNKIRSLKRMSTLISECGEKERILFFKQQRDIINSL